MVGNDVIDLAHRDADAASYSRRFDARVFSAGERRSIALAPESERQRWRLWACKEASYKLARQRELATRFSPIAFRVQLDETPDGGADGCVVHGGQSFRVRVLEGPQWLHAIAIEVDEDFEAVTHSIERLADGSREAADESRAVRAAACTSLAERIGAPAGSLRIERVSRIPQVHRDGERLPFDLSLSHHGNYVAFAYNSSSGMAGSASVTREIGAAS